MFFHLGSTITKKCITAYFFIVSFEKSSQKLVRWVFSGVPNNRETDESSWVLSSVSRCLESLMKPSHLFLIYYISIWNTQNYSVGTMIHGFPVSTIIHVHVCRIMILRADLSSQHVWDVHSSKASIQRCR